MNKLDTNYKHLSKTEIIHKYQQHLKEIEKLANINHIDRKHFHNYLSQSQNYLHFDQQTAEFIFKTTVRQLWLIRRYLLLAACIGLIIMVGLNSTFINGFFMKNIQTFIYPGMSMWRKFTLPMLAIWPEVTQFYDETCLVPNPVFRVKDFDCDPCQRVASVLDLTDMPDLRTAMPVPYIYKEENSTKINIEMLRDMYSRGKTTFDRDARVIRTTNKHETMFDDILDDLLNVSRPTDGQSESHTLWQCNRLGGNLILRQTIGQPSRLPGLSIERYLAVDTPGAAAYSIPSADCSAIFVRQLCGSRTIVLRPTIECRHRCRTLSVQLPESYVLNYDWWYWKPMSLPNYQKPVNSQRSTISHIGAYC